jgi:hypothetical protein
MSATLRRKITQAVKGYLTSNYASWRTVSAVTVVEGENNEEPELPYLVVACMSGEDHETLRAVQMVPMTLILRTGVNPGLTGTAASRANVDTQMKALNDFIVAPSNSGAGFEDSNPFSGALRTALNKPTGTDNRTVKPLHIYDLYPIAEDSDPGGEAWLDSITYMVVCQPMNSS